QASHLAMFPRGPRPRHEPRARTSPVSRSHDDPDALAALAGLPIRRVTYGSRRRFRPLRDEGPGHPKHGLTWTFSGERVTGIEPAFSAWEADRRGCADQPVRAKALVSAYVECPPVPLVVGDDDRCLAGERGGDHVPVLRVDCFEVVDRVGVDEMIVECVAHLADPTTEACRVEV